MRGWRLPWRRAIHPGSSVCKRSSLTTARRGTGDQQRPSARWQRGATTVEFALAGVVFFFLFFGLIDAGWYVFEVSATSNAARNAARWAVAEANQNNCTVTSGLLSAAAAQAGPFAGDIGASGAVTTQQLYSTSVSSDPGCTVTVTLPFSPFAGPFTVGPPTIRESATAYYD